MTIGFDGKRAVGNNTGLGNYSRLVIAEMAKSAPATPMRVYTPRLPDNPRLEPVRALDNVTFVTPVSKMLPAALWRTWGITRQLINDGIDIYHGLSNELPLNIRRSKIPSVVTIHDVIYRRLPKCYSPVDVKIYDYKYGSSCRNADRIIAVSECTKRDIMYYYGINESKIDVVYQGCDSSFKEQWSDDKLAGQRKRLNLPARYIIQVGTIEERKNLKLTVEALPYLDPSIKLIAVGRDNGYKERVVATARRLGVLERIIFMHNIPFTELPGLYQQAEAVTYPSRYEGFGIPVLEGLESRRPVIAATGSCLEEAGGDAAIYVAPDDVRAMAEALKSVTTPGADWSGRIAAGLRHAARFDTSQMADKILGIYKKTLADKT